MKAEKCRMCKEEFDEAPESYCNCLKKYHKTCMEKWLTRYSQMECKYCGKDLKTQSRKPTSEEIEARRKQRNEFLWIYLPVILICVLMLVPVYYILKLDSHLIDLYLKLNHRVREDSANILPAVLSTVLLLLLLVSGVFFVVSVIGFLFLIANQSRKQFLYGKVFTIIAAAEEENSERSTQEFGKCRMCKEYFDEEPKSYCKCSKKYHKTCMEKWVTREARFTSCKYCNNDFKTKHRKATSDEIEARKNQRKVILRKVLWAFWWWIVMNLLPFLFLTFSYNFTYFYISTDGCTDKIKCPKFMKFSVDPAGLSMVLGYAIIFFCFPCSLSPMVYLKIWEFIYEDVYTIVDSEPTKSEKIDAKSRSLERIV